MAASSAAVAPGGVRAVVPRDAAARHGAVWPPLRSVRVPVRRFRRMLWAFRPCVKAPPVCHPVVPYLSASSCATVLVLSTQNDQPFALLFALRMSIRQLSCFHGAASANLIVSVEIYDGFGITAYVCRRCSV